MRHHVCHLERNEMESRDLRTFHAFLLKSVRRSLGSLGMTWILVGRYLGSAAPYKLQLNELPVGNAVPSVPSENLTSMGKFSAFLPLCGRIAEDSDPYTVTEERK